LLKINRKTEYALLALRYLHGTKSASATSVREIAAYYDMPEMIVSKVLQRLKRGNLVDSQKGAMGGYRASRPLTDVRLMDLLVLFEEQTSLVDCIPSVDACDCKQSAHCDIQVPLTILHRTLLQFMEQISLADFFAGTIPKDVTLQQRVHVPIDYLTSRVG
jgi:Rrf2 family protein